MKLLQKNLIISGIVLLCITLLNAQAPDTLWTRRYGGEDFDQIQSIKQLVDGGYIVAGNTRSFGVDSNDVWLLRTNTDGDTLWTRTYGGQNVEAGHCIQITFEGDYIIVGWTNSFGAGDDDFYLIKTKPNGDTLWTKTYGGIDTDRAFWVEQTTDSGYIVYGMTYSFGVAGANDIWLLKTDANGDTLWTKIYVGFEAYSSVHQTSDGGYILGGLLGSTAPNYDACLIKTNTLGDTVWTKSYGGPNQDVIYSFQQTADGGYILAGASYLCGWLIKTDSLGNMLWEKFITPPVSGGPFNSVQQTADGGYIAAGDAAYDVWLVRTNADGDTLWTWTYGGPQYEFCNEVQVTSDQGYVLAVHLFSLPDADALLIKTAPDVGIVEEKITPIQSDDFGATIITGPLFLYEGKKCKVFDITGRTVALDKIKSGIYFIEIDGQITQKVIKVR